MKAFPLCVVAMAFALTSCSSSDGPTDPGGGGGGGGGGGTATVDTIFLNASSFSPAQLTTVVGRTVVWYNPGSGTHTVTPDGHQAFTNKVSSAQGEVMRMVFNAKGTYNYYCNPHLSAGMTGRVVVN